jgi:hypothetical protein
LFCIGGHVDHVHCLIAQASELFQRYIS